MSSQSHLLSERRFRPLLITQFLGALNDNVLKNALVLLLTLSGRKVDHLETGSTGQ
ncbi:MAG: MFS transporter, partial [Desulfobulbaceae bacterium]|nr:MFS transporter [Desulfobulbaceae bacterium]